LQEKTVITERFSGMEISAALIERHFHIKFRESNVELRIAARAHLGWLRR
jgi:hypothetical protein